MSSDYINKFHLAVFLLTRSLKTDCLHFVAKDLHSLQEFFFKETTSKIKAVRPL